MLEKSRAWLEREDRVEGIHASDVLSPRIGYWSTVDPKPLADRLVTMFLVGKVLHSFVLSAVEGIQEDLDRTDAGSRESKKLGIWYSPDRLVKGEVTEFKTARNFKAPDTLDDLWTYVEQLVVYMAATETRASKLWVLYLNLRDEEKRTAPEFRCYTLSLSQADLARAKSEVRQRAEDLRQALEQKDHTGLPLCAEWKCGATKCDWWDQCRPEGRWRE